MAKAKESFVCSSCAAETLKWMGKCPQCGEWDSLKAKTKTKTPKSKTKISAISISDAVLKNDIPRVSVGIGEVDRVLGGGLVPGSMTLLGGSPGIGKSTLVSQLLSSVATNHQVDVLYVTGEESVNQSGLRCARLGIDNPRFHIVASTDIGQILSVVDELSPAVVAIDSVQTLQGATASGAGTVSQIRECTMQLMNYAKKNDVSMILIGHVTKGGEIAGPKLLEHMVDTVLYFSDDKSNYRVIRSHKNRFGSTHELGVFEMQASGLHAIENPSALLLEQRNSSVPGSCVVACIEGSRPLLAEVQALVVPQTHGMPRRVTLGVDTNRVALLLAILAQRGGLNALASDVFVSLAGGLKINAPDLDLGITLAIASAVLDKCIPPDVMCIGEVGLSGEVRNVAQLESRIKEAKNLGFSRCVIPAAAKLSKNKHRGIKLIRVASVKQALGLFQK